MSATLYALVVLQGTTLNFSPGYASAAECLSVYKGPNVACFDYDPEGTTWTAFFKLGDSFRVTRRFPDVFECQRFIAAFKSDIPAACRQLAYPEPCRVTCVAPLQPPPPTGTIPPPPPAAKPEPPPEPKFDPANIQVNGQQHRIVTFTEKRDAFADVAVGPSELEAKDLPTITPLLSPPMKAKTARRTAPRRQQYAYAQFDPISTILGFFTPRDW